VPSAKHARAVCVDQKDATPGGNSGADQARESVVLPLPPFRAIAAMTTRLSFGMVGCFLHKW
jgi:hypothetical protein